MGSGSQQFCLKWNNHHSNMLNVFEHLLSSEALVDVTLACEGLSLKAHKMVLSACSPFFQSLFLENPCKHPIVILKDMRYTDLKAIIDFMYRGEVNVSQNQLSALLKTAETLKVKGLAEVSGEDGQSNGSGVVQREVVQQTVPQATATPTGGSATQGATTPASGTRAETPPLSRRKRGRPRRRSLSDSNRSDSEDQVPAKIREAESPEVIEDRDMDTSSSNAGAVEGSNGVQKLPLPLQTQTQPQSQESRLAIDEITSGDEGDFLPSKLMEQSMTTENVPVFPESQSTGSTVSPTPSQRLMLGSSSLVERSMQGPSTSDSQALVPVSQSSDISGTGHSSQDIPEDIKPTGLVSYDEPSLSPVAGPSHSQDGSAMMMYMDSSGVPAIPGPSNYQPDKQSSSQPQPSQGITSGGVGLDVKLGRRPVPHVCKLCGKFFQSTFEYRRHLIVHRCGRQKLPCQYCSQSFYWKSTLYRHIREVHNVEPPPSTVPSPVPLEQLNYAPLSPGGSKKRGRQPGSRLCGICKKVFNGSSEYNEHVATHWKSGVMKESCPDAIKAGDGLTTSQVALKLPPPIKTKPLTDIEQAYPSPFGDADVTGIEFAAMNIKPPASCIACQTKLGSFSSFSYHLMASTSCRVKQFSCNICPKNKTFIWPATLLRHLKEQHASEYGRSLQSYHSLSSSSPLSHKPGTLSNDWYFCEICHKAFLNKTGIGLHMKKFHPENRSSSPQENSSEIRSGALQAYTSQVDRLSPSSQSYLGYSVIEALLSQKKRGRKPGTRVCKMCKKTFAGQDNLLLHLQHCHQGLSYDENRFEHHFDEIQYDSHSSFSTLEAPFQRLPSVTSITQLHQHHRTTSSHVTSPHQSIISSYSINRSMTLPSLKPPITLDNNPSTAIPVIYSPEKVDEEEEDEDHELNSSLAESIPQSKLRQALSEYHNFDEEFQQATALTCSVQGTASNQGISS